MENQREDFTNIFIKNLDPDFDDDDLEHYFKRFGYIISHRIAKDHYGQSKGYGYVEYAKPQEAAQAVRKMDGFYLDGNKLSVGKFISKNQREELTEGLPKKFTNIYIKNFGDEFDTAKLYKLFKRFGTIVRCKVETDEYNRSKGFGYVCFSDHKSAESAVNEMNGRELRNKKILFVAPHMKKAQRQNELNRRRQESISCAEKMNLYVKNLDTSVDDDRLKKMFLPFGNITSAKVSTDENGESKKFGYVCFENHDSAKKALDKMDGKMIASKKLYVNWYERKEERRSRLFTEHLQSAITKLPKSQFGASPPHAKTIPSNPYESSKQYLKPSPNTLSKQVYAERNINVIVPMGSSSQFSFGSSMQFPLNYYQAIPSRSLQTHPHLFANGQLYPKK